MSEKSTLMSVKSTLKLILPTLKLILPTLKLILSTLKLIFPTLKLILPTLKLILPTLKLAKRKEKITKWHQEASVIFVPTRCRQPFINIVNEVKMHQRQPAHCILFCKIPRCSGATSFRYFLVVENNIIKF